MPRPRRDRDINRYAALLLFQFRVVVAGRPNKRRLVERRIVLFRAIDAPQALRKAKSYGRTCEHDYTNGHGNPVYFEFVGVLDLLHLGVECDDNEVWYEIAEMVEPMERRSTLLLPDEELTTRARGSGTDSPDHENPSTSLRHKRTR